MTGPGGLASCASSGDPTLQSPIHVMSREGTRTAVMRSIRKKDTRPELAVRRLVHKLGYRFRLHRRDLPGCPDLVLPRHRAVILVHGCFWHQHAGCKLARQPPSNREYWMPKLARNVERDRTTHALLTDLGWRVLVVWECEIGDPVTLEQALRRFFDAC